MQASMYDPQIRNIILPFIRRRAPSSRLIEELHINNGISIADIVCVGRNAHCYEIKSDYDKISRISTQSKSYDASFYKTTLITTVKQLDKALNAIPSHWGVLLVGSIDGRAGAKYARAATPSPEYSPEIALRMLWKVELCKIAQNLKGTRVPSKWSRDDLIAFICSTVKSTYIQKSISQSLFCRESQSYFKK